MWLSGSQHEPVTKKAGKGIPHCYGFVLLSKILVILWSLHFNLYKCVLSHVNALFDTHKLTGLIFQSLFQHNFPKAATMVGFESWVKFLNHWMSNFRLWSAFLFILLQHETQSPFSLLLMKFNVSVPLWCTVVDMLVESRHMQTWRLHHMTKAYVCLLSLDQSVLSCVEQ